MSAVFFDTFKDQFAQLAFGKVADGSYPTTKPRSFTIKISDTASISSATAESAINILGTPVDMEFDVSSGTGTARNTGTATFLNTSGSAWTVRSVVVFALFGSSPSTKRPFCFYVLPTTKTIDNGDSLVIAPNKLLFNFNV